MTAIIESPPSLEPESLAIDYRFPYPLFLKEPYTSGPRGYIGYLSLFDRYADSEDGEFHATQPPRFVGDFGYDQEHDYAQMIWDLGFNTHPRDHMQTVYAANRDLFFFQVLHKKKFDKLCKWLDPADFPIVRLVNPLHDVGENASPVIRAAVGAVVGDIAHGKKTPEHKRIEAGVRKYVFSSHYPDIPEWMMQRVEAITSHAEDSPAHQMYVWGHEFETYRTSEIAANCVLETLNNGGPFDLRFEQLTKLAREVGGRTREVLGEAATHFVLIQKAMKEADIFFDNFEKRIKAGV